MIGNGSLLDKEKYKTIQIEATILKFFEKRAFKMKGKTTSMW
jgi:hypothetical protein